MSSTDRKGLFGPDRIRPGYEDTEWSVWITGADDILDQPNKETALAVAAEMNAGLADIHTGNPFEPVAHAVVLHRGYAWKRGDDQQLQAVPTITPTVANHVLHHYGHGGYPAGDFTRQLIATIAAADMDNKAKLASAYPGYTAAIIGIEYDPDGITALTTLAASGGPVGCRRCGDTTGPFDPTTGLCEDCLATGGAK